MTDYTDLKRRLEAATEGVTPGPWLVERFVQPEDFPGDENPDVHLYLNTPSPHGVIMAKIPYEDWTPPEKDWGFIAAARDLVPEALAAIAALEAEVARLTAELDRMEERVLEAVAQSTDDFK